MDKDLKDAVEVARYLVSQYKEHTKVYFVASALIRAATQQPEVVTVGALVKEENDVLLFEGYKGDFKTAQQNVEHALRVIAKAFPHGLKIVEG